MKNFKNVKNITATVKFHGNGIVNGSTKDDVYTYARLGFKNNVPENYKDTVSYSKKIFTKLEDGTFGYKHMVSATCLRNNMFRDYIAFQDPNITNVEIAELFYSALATPQYLERGWMFCEKGEDGQKNKSILTMTDAIAEMQPSNVIATTINTISGTITKNKVRYTETLGELDYTSTLFIDLGEAQFLSLDQRFDRNAIEFKGNDKNGTPYREKYLEYLKVNFGLNEKPTISYYYPKTSVYGDHLCEYGIKFTSEMVDMMVHDILMNVANIEINRKDAYFAFKEMEIKVNMADGTSETIIIRNGEQNLIKDYSFTCEEKYVKSSKTDEENNEMKAKFEKWNADRRKKEKDDKKSNTSSNKAEVAESLAD